MPTAVKPAIYCASHVENIFHGNSRNRYKERSDRQWHTQIFSIKKKFGNPAWKSRQVLQHSSHNDIHSNGIWMTRCQETLDYISGTFMMQNRFKIKLKKQCSKITRYLITFWIFTQHSEHIIHFTSHAVTYANKQKSFTWLICVTGTCLMTKSTLYLYQIVSIYN